MGQQTATFESLVTGTGEVYNASEVADSSTTYIDAGVSLSAAFQRFPGGFSSWGPFAISSVSDTVTPGFANQFAARPGSGYNGSDAYAVSFGNGAKMKLTEGAIGQVVEGMYITNSTYTYYVIRDGNMFSEAFGGESGNDPDYFLLTIKGYRDGALTTDSVNFTLADYRFEDNSQDYVVDEWTYVDLSGLGAVDSLEFSYFSTDVGMFGINTPLYFCMDNITTAGDPSSLNELADYPEIQLYPNPVHDQLNLTTTSGLTGLYQIVDLYGRTVKAGQLNGSIAVNELPKGQYQLLLQSDRGVVVRRFIK